MMKLYTLELDNIIHYVGITKMSLNERLYYHRSKRETNSKKKAWFIMLKEHKLKAEIKLLDEFKTLEEAKMAEIFYIALFKYYGFDLLNNSKGGEYNRNPEGMPVKQYTLQGDYITTFTSPKQAARSLNKNCSKEIRNCCKGNSSKAQEFVWRFKKDPFTKYKVLKTNEIQSKAIRDAISIKIERYDKHNNLLEIHPSISNIVIRKLGNAGQIRMILKGVRMYSKGFYFKRHDEDIVQST